MVRQLIHIALVTVAVGTPLIVLVKSTLDFWRASSGRSRIIFKGLAALAIWFVVSWGMMFMLFLTFFGAAHTDYRMSHNGAPDPSGNDDPTGSISLLIGIYALIGSGLVYWMLRRARRKLPQHAQRAI
jgi:hypothetical protein